MKVYAYFLIKVYQVIKLCIYNLKEEMVYEREEAAQ